MYILGTLETQFQAIALLYLLHNLFIVTARLFHYLKQYFAKYIYYSQERLIYTLIKYKSLSPLN